MGSTYRGKAYSELITGLIGLVLVGVQWRIVRAHSLHRVFASTGLLIVALITAVFLWS